MEKTYNYSKKSFNITAINSTSLCLRQKAKQKQNKTDMGQELQ